MNEDERKKKIEVGRQKLAHFKKKKGRNSSVGVLSPPQLLLDAPNVADQVLNNSKVMEGSECNKENEEHEHSAPEDHIALLMSEYSQKINKFQEALEERDRIINQLSDRLASTLAMQHTIQKEGFLQAETLASEISVLRRQLQEASEVLSQQKGKNGISAQQLLESRNQAILLQDKSHQKDIKIKSLSQKIAALEQEINDISHELQVARISPVTCDLATETEEFLWKVPEKETKDADVLCKLHPVNENSDISSEKEANVDSDAINLSLPANDVACDPAERAFKSVSCIEMGVQVDATEMNSSLLVFPPSLETHSINKLLVEFNEDPNGSSRNVLFSSIQKLIEENQELQAYVSNLRTADKSPSFVELTENEGCSSGTAIATQGICKKSPNEVLKRLEYLNDITKTVESLLNIVKNDVSKSILWSPSKFQASVLSSLHFDDSVMSKKLDSPDSRHNTVASNTDSSSSNHGASLVSSGSEPNSNTMLCQDLSFEILRRHNISDKLLCLREFIREELDTCISEVDIALETVEVVTDKKNAPRDVLQSTENTPDASLTGSADSLISDSQKESHALHKNIILHKQNLESSLQNFKMLEENLRDKGSFIEKKDSGSEKFSECDLLSEKFPFSCVSLLSFSDTDSKIDLGDVIWDMNWNEVEIGNAVEVGHHQETKPSGSNLPSEMGSDISDHAQCTAVEGGSTNLAELEASKNRFYDSHKEHSPSESHKEQKSFESHMERQLYDSHETRERASSDSSNLRQRHLIVCDYEKLIHQIKEKYTNEVLNMKLNLENSYNVEKSQLENRIEELESLKDQLEANEKKFTSILAERELQCENHVSQIKSIINEHDQQIADAQLKLGKCDVEKAELLIKVKDLQEALMQANKQKAECLEAKAKVEYSLQNQIADLVQDHQQDIEIIKKEAFDALNQEKRRLEKDYQVANEKLKSDYEDEKNDMKESLQKCFEEEKQKIIEKQNQILLKKETQHAEDISSYQKKVEVLLEEKCGLLTKHQADFENIIKSHHNILENLCFHLQSQVSKAKCKMTKAENGSNGPSSEDILNDLSQTFEEEVNSLLKENVLASRNKSSKTEDTLNVGFGERYPNEEGINWKKQVTKLLEEINLLKDKHELEIESLKQQNSSAAAVLENFDPEQLQSMMLEEMNKLQKDFEEEMEIYKKSNEQLAEELELVRNKIYVLEEHNTKLQHQLKKKDESQDTSELNQLQLDNSSVRSSVNSPQISAGEIRAWRVHAAQTNSRLLHVLSDIVKTFLDIEHDINRHLMQFGLISPNADMCVQHDDDTVQSIGSREDFTALSVGESPNLDLTEDGPDLTPRAWDLFNSVGTYDAEIEGEDVVIGASRRLRSAVDQVLYYLSRALENLQSHDLKALLKRNEELSQDLQEESHGKDALQVDLVNAESVIRKTEAEKHKLENANFQLLEEKEALARELALTKEKLKIVEEDKELAYEEQQQLMEQRDLLARGLGDPEQISAGIDKVRSHSEPLMHEESALLEENAKLSTEKRNIQKHLSKERQSLVARLHQLELSYDEVAAQKEEILERKKREVEDLKSQMEAMEKQLQSNRKFIEEQAQEREQEREEYLRELNKLEEIVREKERIQNNEDQLTKEVENMEQLLKAKIEEHKTVMTKKEDLESELRQSFDKVHDLRDIIGELEKQLDMKTRTESELKKQFAELLESLSVQEKNVTDLPKEQEERIVISSNRESLEQVRDLEEQLASRTQELEQLTQSQVLLQELRGQIHFLEAKVEQKTRQLETMHFSSLCASPAPSDDTSHSESHDGELHVHVEDGWGEMSPRSLHWLEIRRLEEKIGRLVHIEEELIKRNKDLDSQLRKLKISEEEHRHEKAALQEQATEQLLQLSALKSRIEEQRHRTTLPTNAEFITELEDLREALNREQVQRKMTEADLNEVKSRLDGVKAELERKNTLIKQLKIDIQKAEDGKHHSSTDTKSEKSESDVLEQEESDSEHVPHFIKLLIQEKNEHIDSLSSQLDSLQDELASLQGDSPRSLLMCVSSSDEQKQVELKDKEICDLKKKKNDLKNQIQHLEMRISDLTKEVDELKSRNSELEDLLKDTRKQLEAEQVQVTTLLEEVGSLTNYQKHLEDDFNEVQDMAQMKEKELATLQEETESQLRLEAEIDTLYQLLADQRSVEKELKQKVNELQKTLEETERAHMVEADQWHLHLDEVTQKFIVEKENLEKQVKILRQNLMSAINSEDVYIQLVWRHITDAAETLNGQVERLEVFEQMVLHLLKQMVTFISDQMKGNHETEIQTLNKNWQEKMLADQEKYNGTLREMAAYKTRCQLYEEERQTLQSKHQDELQVTRSAMAQIFKEEQERLCTDKDKYWQERLQQVEKLVKTDKESSEKLITAELQIQELSNKVEEVKKTLQEMHQREMSELKQALDKATKEKDTLSLEHRKELSKLENLMQSQHEKEKNNLVEEYKTKLLLLEEQLKRGFSSQTQELERSYQQQILELQKTLNHRLEGEREHLQAKHKEELGTLHTLFEKRWEDELEKLRELHQEELKQLKGCREETVEEIFGRLFSVYENKLKSIQTECEQQIARERQNNFASHQVELQNLQKVLEEKFRDEKQKILESSENQMRVVKEELEKKYEKEMLEKLENAEMQLLSDRIKTVEEDWQKKWESGRRKLQAAHQKEITCIRERYEFQLNKQRESLLRTHEEKMKQMEETYNQELQNARDILKELKAASLKDPRSGDNLSSRTQTPTSEVTTSSDQTSSSYTDAIPPHIKLLADEVHHEGLRVLSLTKNNRADQHLPFSDENIYWREERLWIVNRLKFITEVDERSDLKQVINTIIEELIHARVSYESLNTKEKKLQELIVQLQNQIQAQSNLLHEVQKRSSDSVERSYGEPPPTPVKHQKSFRQESKKSLNATMANGDSYHNEYRRRSEDHSEENSDRRRGSTSSTPAEIERLRSGDVSISLEKFSTSVPEAASLLSPRFQKSTNSHFKECERCAFVEGVLVEERLRWIEEKAVLQESIQAMENRCATMGNKMHLLASQKNKEPILASEAKLHRLYWKYRRSESYHKALVFQKKYLLNLISGFHATEEVTLSILDSMGVTLSKHLELLSPNSTASDSVHRGASLFRATAYAIISIVRMKFLAKRWQQAARVPPIHIITLEVDSAVKLPPPTPKARPMSHSSSSSSKHSGTPSVENVSTDYRTRRRSYAMERSESSPLADVQSQLPGSEQLLEYVNRLAALHEQLGLSDLDKS